VGRPVASDPAGIEEQNTVWWSLRELEKPHTCTVPLDAVCPWPLKVAGENGRQHDEKVGGFCHCPLPVSGYERWGFEVRAERDRFAALYGASL
jgi:hypothetical protein